MDEETIRAEAVIDSVGNIDVIIFEAGHYDKPLFIISKNKWECLNRLVKDKLFGLSETIKEKVNETA